MIGRMRRNAVIASVLVSGGVIFGEGVAAGPDPQMIPGNCAIKMRAATKAWTGVPASGSATQLQSRSKRSKNQLVRHAADLVPRAFASLRRGSVSIQTANPKPADRSDDSKCG